MASHVHVSSAPAELAPHCAAGTFGKRELIVSIPESTMVNIAILEDKRKDTPSTLALVAS